MKLSNAASWLSGTDAIFGLEVCVNAELQKEFRLVEIVKKDAALHAQSFKTYYSVKELLDVLPESAPVVLLFNGKGIIHRGFNLKSEDDAEIIKAVFPDIKAEDFFYQIAKTTTAGVLSLIRKELVLEFIAQFEIKKINFLSLSLGPFITADFWKIIEQYKVDVLFDFYHIQTDNNGGILDYKILSESNNQTITIADEKVDGVYVNAYAASCTYLITGASHTEYSYVNDIFFQEQAKKYKSLILKKRGGLVFLASILIVLLINFFVFSNYRKENIAYQDHLSVYQTKLKRLDSMEAFIQAKKGFIENAGWGEKNILSRQCDIIAQTVPDEIRLTELTIHPVNIAESRKLKESVFINKQIIIKGETRRIVVLNDWLEKLNTKAFIQGLKMEEYHFDANSQQGQFKLIGEIQ